jgi:hypothetical protein
MIVGIMPDTHDRLPMIDEAVKQLNKDRTAKEVIVSSHKSFIPFFCFPSGLAT